MADDDNQSGDDAPPQETAQDVLQGDPKDPDSPMRGASFGDATEGASARKLPPKKPKSEPKEKPDEDKPDDAKSGDQEDKSDEEQLEDKKSDEKSKDEPEEKPADKEDKKEKPEARPDRDNIDKKEGAESHMVMSPADKDEDGKEDEGRKLAIFDFDGTLIEQDCLDLFIRHAIGGKWKARLYLLPALLTAFLEAIFTTDDYMDYKSAIKAHWMINTLKGLPVERVAEIAKEVKKEVDWRDKLVADLKRFADSGVDVVIATGAIDLFIKPLIDQLPITALICSHAEVKDGKLTGRMSGKRKDSVNVVRGEKRFRTQAYINERGPFVRVIGYGNMPDDGPMLSLCDEFYIVDDTMLPK